MNGESTTPHEPSTEFSPEEPLFNPQGVDDAGRPLQPEGQPEDLASEATGPEQEGERSLLATNATGPGPAITRETIIARAEAWLHPPVPYSQERFKLVGERYYRQDCSGYVSMAWHTDSKYWWTGTLHEIGVPISYNDLRPGDMLLYHNRAEPKNGSHVVLFHRWVGAVGGDFYIYHQTGPNTKHQVWPQRYSRSKYQPFRYVNVYVHGSYSGDSLADLLVLDPTTGVIRYFPNNGPGNWGAEAEIGSGWNGFNPNCLYFADMTGDGRADLLALDPATGVIRYFPNNGPGNWGAEADIGSGWNGVDPNCLYFA